jgi:glycosyltransferase involved in cell wall biosynthesis
VPTFAFVGRLSPNKRPQDALRAFELVQRSVPEARLWVLGSGPLEHQLRRRAPQNVEFLGRVGESEKLDRMARAHALVVTSVREGWGLVVTEAASVGTPSIAYNVPGLRDSVSASGGILVGPSPRLIGERMVAEIPRLLAGALEVAPSGVTSWDRVADGLLAVALGGSAPTHSRFRQSLPVVAQSSAR